MVKKIIKTYQIFSGCLVLAQSGFFATYQIFLFSRGLDLMQINLVNVFFMLATFLLEVPTGTIADTFGRGKSTALGCFIISGSYLIYFWSTTFWFFVLAEVIGALGLTLISGAAEAWVVDSLKFHNYTGTLEKIYKREGFFRLFGVIIGSTIGAWLGNKNIALPWLVCSLAIGAVGIFAWFKLKEEYFPIKKFSWSLKPLQKTAYESIQFGFQHKGIFYAIAFGAFCLFCFQGLNMHWPIFFSAKGVSVGQMGYISSGLAVSIFLGSILAEKIAQKINHEKNTLIVSQVITALSIILLSVLGKNLGLALSFFFLHEIGRGALRPLRQAYLNRRIPGEKRATVLSFDSMIGQFGAAGGLLLSGYLANNFSITFSWLMSGIVLAMILPIFWRLKNGD